MDKSEDLFFDIHVKWDGKEHKQNVVHHDEKKLVNYLKRCGFEVVSVKETT